MKTINQNTATYFSKQKFKHNLICYRRGWLSEHKSELFQNNSSAVAEDGLEFERVARELLAPGGIEIPFNRRKFAAAAKETKRLLMREQAVVYQAVFLTNTGELAIADVVVKNASWIHVYEFKASSVVTDLHVYDCAFQIYCAKNSGYSIKSVNVVLYNKDYIKNGLHTKELFLTKDITAVTQRVLTSLPGKIAGHKKNLSRAEEPDEDLGIKCFKPHDCPAKDHCFHFLGTNNVFDVRGMKLNTKLHLYYKGITDMAAIRERAGNKPSEKGIIQMNSVLSNSIVIQKEELRKWLEPLRTADKLYFFDVETISPVVPVIEQTQCKTVIVTQYSCHIESADGSLVHTQYLADPKSGDFRKELLIKLLVDLDATNGSAPIICWNMSYEVGCLKRYALLYPEFSAEIKKLISRVVDLMAPFRDMLYVDPRFKGSYSIKAVLPVLCPDLSYKDLKINNGDSASMNFLKLYSANNRESQEIRENLKLYCTLDTLAMQRILKFLFTI